MITRTAFVFLTLVLLALDWPTRLVAEAPRRALNSVTFHAATQHPPVIVARDGQPVATICVMGKPSAKLLAAVKELQTMLAEATGATLAIEKNKLVAPAIVVGDCDLARDHGLIGSEMPIDGFAIKTLPDHILIVGRDEVLSPGASSAGTTWGVCEFLERFVDVRWYFPGELGQSIPKRATLVVEPVWLSDAPVFRMRDIWPPVGQPYQGRGTPLGPLQNFLRAGNSWPRSIIVHSPDWSKVDEYKRDRPEVYQLRSDGTRDFVMLCYGHPRTLETYLENIEKALNKDRTAKIRLAGDTITVSPADAEIACYCEHCRKLWNPDGGMYGSASKIVATFTASLAREVERRWPQLNVLYLPYLNYSDAPDGVTMPRNVQIQLCGMPGLAQYKEPATAAAEQRTIDRWIEISGDRIENWHYSCWPEDRTPAVYLFPHTIQDFYRRNRDKTVGSFVNGTGDHWPRQHLSLYCWMKLLWNPDFDVDAALDEYCDRMYGPAAATMRELVRLQCDAWEKSRWPSGRLSPKAIYEVSFPPQVVARLEQLLNQAREQLAGHDPELARLEYYAQPFAEFFRQSRDYHSGGGLRPLIVQKVGENPKVDGELDDAVWQRAQANTFVAAYDKTGKPCVYPTTVRGVWTQDGVTFGFRMTEPTPNLLTRNIKGRDDSMAWWDDNVELLIDVTGRNDGAFFHWIVTANNAVADADGKDFSKNFETVRSAVQTGPDYWSLEVFLPYSALAGAVVPGSGSNTVWFGNFTRHRVADRGLKPANPPSPGSVREYQRMNTTFAGPSNNLADFAPLRFSE